MKNFILCLSVFLSHSALATIWITISDPKGHKIGVVGASSGYVGDYRTMVPVDNKGIAVVGSWYLGRKQKHLVDLIKNEALTASEVVKEFGRLINRDFHKRRVSFVNSRFENASEPGRGCHGQNQYCGKYEDPMFTITGGGLVSEDVIHSARIILQDKVLETGPIECRMYHAMKAIFHAGGELKTINRLAYIIDDLKRNGDTKISLFHRKGHEESLLEQFDRDLKAQGFNCSL